MQHLHLFFSRAQVYCCSISCTNDASGCCPFFLSQWVSLTCILEIFSCHLCLLGLQSLLVRPLAYMCTSPSLDALSYSLRLTACIRSHPALSLPAHPPLLEHAAVWSVLPWHHAARMRLHTSILCSLHRGQLTRRCDVKHTVYERSRVDCHSGICNSV